MKPQKQPASSPQPTTASQHRSRALRSPASRGYASVETSSHGSVEDVDFYSLRQARIREEEVARGADLRLVPLERELEGSDLDEKFDRLVEGERQRSRPKRKASKKPSVAKAPCAPCHYGLLFATLLLTVLSIPLVYSASTAIALENNGNPDFFLTRQIMFALIGFGVMVGASRLSSAQVRKMSWVLYGVAVLGLILTKFSPLGFSMGNTERWVKLGPLTLQFSELAKIALIGVMADFWSRAAKDSQRSMWPWAAVAVIAGIPLVLTFLQPHLSATLVLFALPVAIAFYAGAPRKHFITIFASLAVLGIVTISLCKTGNMPLMAKYQQARIAAHFGGDGKSEAKTSDYQKLQGERAIMRGGVRGVGPGASLYKMGHLPAPHTDFIYAVIGEEWGLFGTLGLIGLYGAIVFFCFQTGHAAENSFDALVCAGVGTLMGVQAAGNIGVVSGVLPVTGMPLPFLTYGGSGLICALLGIGLVLAISRSHCDEA
ncbi:cell division protein FtsW [bacterium]|nr:MAG: cell division protein FtsW [bacterium]